MNSEGSENTRNSGKQNRTVHLPSLDHRDVGCALAVIRDCGAWWAVRCCILFLALTCVRSREARGATWDEIDFETATWTIPASRMKTGIEHRVPLSSQAMEVLAYARSQSNDPHGLIFPPQRGGQYMSVGILSRLLRSLEIPCVPHGFRATFMNWTAESSNVPQAVTESVLAHTPPNTVVAAFLRSDLFEQRRAVMQEWGNYVTETRGPVIAAPLSSP